MPRHSKRKNTPDSPARDLEIYDLVVLRGWSQRRAAAAYGLSQPRVSQIVRDVNQELRVVFLESIRNVKVMHQQQLEELFFQAMQGWRRSVGTVTETRKKSIELEAEQVGVTVPAMEVTTIERVQAGDVRFLEFCRTVLADIRKMWDNEISSAEQSTSGGQRIAGKSLDEIRKGYARRLQDQLEKINSVPEQN